METVDIVEVEPTRENKQSGSTSFVEKLSQQRGESPEIEGSWNTSKLHKEQAKKSNVIKEQQKQSSI